MTTEQGAPEAGAWKDYEWPALKKALWDVVVGEELNAGHYVKAFDFTEKLYQAALAASPSPPPVGVAEYNIEAIAKIISLSYGEDPDDFAPLSKICGPNNEPLPNWVAYDEQAKAIFVWFDAVLLELRRQEPPVGGEVVKLAIREFANAILHGDDEHRQWLLDAAECFIAGEVMPPTRGKGSALVPSSPSLLGPRFKIRQLGEIEFEGVDGEPEHINGLVLEALSDDDVRAAGSLFGQTVTVGVSS